MSQAQAASGRDRLPWLANEATPERRFSLPAIGGWLVAAALLVGGGAYWIVDRNLDNEAAPQVAPARTTTIALPTAKPGAKKALGTLKKASAPPHHRSSLAVPPVAKPAVEVAKTNLAPRHQNVAFRTPRNQGVALKTPRHPNVFLAAQSKSVGAKPKGCACEHPSSTIASAVPPKVLRPQKSAAAPIFAQGPARSAGSWPPPALGSSLIQGRVVQLAAFAQAEQAKLVWRDIVHAYPAVAQFQPSLIENRDWNGRPFFQFQLGTASHADSEMLCQSMQRLNFRCAVVGQRWKPQG